LANSKFPGEKACFQKMVLPDKFGLNRLNLSKGLPEQFQIFPWETVAPLTAMNNVIVYL